MDHLESGAHAPGFPNSGEPGGRIDLGQATAVNPLLAPARIRRFVPTNCGTQNPRSPVLSRPPTPEPAHRFFGPYIPQVAIAVAAPAAIFAGSRDANIIRSGVKSANESGPDRSPCNCVQRKTCANATRRAPARYSARADRPAPRQYTGQRETPPGSSRQGCDLDQSTEWAMAPGQFSNPCRSVSSPSVTCQPAA